MSDKLSLNNPVFWNYVGCSTACLFKMALMAPMTGVQRRKQGVYSNPEDVTFHSKGGKECKIDLANQAVERVRRNHLNDLENIPMFVMLGGMYVLTDPDPTVAIWHFRVFTMSRILHTIMYQKEVPQPARAITFLIGMGCSVSMIVQIARALFR